MNIQARRWFALLFALLLGGCAGMRPAAAPAPSDFFSDALFAAPSEAIGADDLFSLSPAMRSYLHSRHFTHQLREKGAERGLIDALYQKGELKLDYDAAITRNAAQTFEARAGNCMSLVVMTAAFAKELGMRVYYQNVMAEPTWSRDHGLYFGSNHVNLSFEKPFDARGNFRRDGMLTVDFLPPQDLAGYRVVALDEKRIVAMYLNNRAAEALAGGRLDDAYWWSRAALGQDASFVNAYNTLAVVYNRHGNLALGERVLRGVLEREPANTVAMHNLVHALAAQGKGDESRTLAAHLAALDPHPPFQDFNRGMAAMRRGDYKAAKTLFAKEVAGAPSYHEFHFWLALAHLRLGEADAARAELALALQTSITGEARKQYSAKLEHLRSANPSVTRAY